MPAGSSPERGSGAFEWRGSSIHSLAEPRVSETDASVPPKSRTTAAGGRAPSRPREPLATLVATVLVWGLVLLPPFFYWPPAKDSFRLPKLVLCGVLALAAVFFLAARLSSLPKIDFRKVLAEPVVRALGPLLLVASLGLLTSSHRGHVAAGLASFAVGALSLAAFSWGFTPARLRLFLVGGAWAAALLSLVAVLQYHNLWEPLKFARGEGTGRLGITSYAGNPGDLGAFWALPMLVAQAGLVAAGRRRWLALGVLAVGLYTVAISQSLTAIAAVGVGTVVLWSLIWPWKRVLALAGGLLLTVAALVLVVGPLRHRVADKLGDLKGGQLNRLLTGRLDGWRAAQWMFEQHPLVGVGHGAYRTEFGRARVSLIDRGVQFFRSNLRPVFANAHNEYLEVAAEWGLVGLLALAWAIWVVVRLLVGRSASGVSPPAVTLVDRALAWAGLVALAVLSVSYFPFRVAMIAYPAVIFLAWVFATFRSEASS